MNQIKVFFIVTAFLWASADLRAEQITNADKGQTQHQGVNEEKGSDYHDIIDHFFKLAENQQFDQAADDLFADVLVSKSPDISNKSYFDDVKAKVVNLPKVYGKYCHHSRMFERAVATRFVYVDYIVLFEKQPVEFSFQFYQPKDKWMLYGFTLDTDIVNTMEKKIREKLLITEPKVKT